MATQADRDDALLRDIRLVQNPDGQWTAHDVEHDLVAQADSREAALEALDEVVLAAKEDGGHAPTDGELRELDVDPDVARSQAEELPDVLQ